MAKYLAQIILAGSRVLGRAFAKALKEEYVASQHAAKARSNQSSSSSSSTSSTATDAITGMTLDEAKQILNVQDISNAEEISKKYSHLFEVNDKKKGGSLYLQSKIYRAKERIDDELQTSKRPPAPPADSLEDEPPSKKPDT